MISRFRKKVAHDQLEGGKISFCVATNWWHQYQGMQGTTSEIRIYSLFVRTSSLNVYVMKYSVQQYMISPEEDSIVFSKALECVLNAAEHSICGRNMLYLDGSVSRQDFPWDGSSCVDSGVGTGVAVPLLGWEADGTGAEIYWLCRSKWGRNSRWDGNGMEWAAQISLWDCRPIPSHPIPVPHARPIQSHDHHWFYYTPHSCMLWALQYTTTHYNTPCCITSQTIASKREKYAFRREGRPYFLG